jgi:transcriptional regulator with XRE-family HTH domain
MDDMVQRKELGSFLRARREATDPVAVGVRPGERRRTPGLRREEMAQLTGMSVTWYTWLEQGRQIGVSRQVIESLARELRLTSAERSHLFTLAGLAIPTDTPAPPRVDDTLRRLVETLDPNPAYVINAWWDILAYNAAYSALLGGLDQRSPAECNLLWLNFAEHHARKIMLDWPAEAAHLVGQLRANLGRYPKDPRGPELVEQLRTTSPKFVELWEKQTVDQAQAAHKRFRHPRAGRLDLDYVKLAATDDGQQQLLVFLPSDAASAAKLPQLVTAEAERASAAS